MKTRLALVAARTACEGPWMRARGNEKSVRVRGLAKGERIISRLDIAGVIQPSVILTTDGTWPLPKFDRISFCKECLDVAELGTTHVDLLVE